MQKLAKVIFIISLVISVILIAISVIYILLQYNIIDSFLNNNYVAANKGVRKSSYIINIPDVELLDKYQEKGKDMLIIVMASWCHFCQDESEDLNRFINDNPGKKIIVVSHDDTMEDIEIFLKEHGYNWFVIFDPDMLIRNHIAPGSSGIPAAYLLDSNNNILNEHVGKLDYEGISELYNY